MPVSSTKRISTRKAAKLKIAKVMITSGASLLRRLAVISSQAPFAMGMVCMTRSKKKSAQAVSLYYFVVILKGLCHAIWCIFRKLSDACLRIN